MLEKTKKIKLRFEELDKLVVDPNVIADNKEWQKLCKERSNLEPIIECHNKLEKEYANLNDAEKLLKTETDKEMRELAEEELLSSKEKIKILEEELKILLLPKDENDDKNVIVEIRPAAGGDESGLFARELMNMYIRYAERNGWKVEFNDFNETELGGLKEVVFTIKGKNVYSKLKYESGVHRVQRVPETESQGRVHTSTVTVAVLPEVEDVDFEINDKDLRVDTYRSSGAGGQHVNKTESAIRITHIPTGIVVACQNERSQLQNREQAMKMLYSKLYDFYKEQSDSKIKEDRKNQVGTRNRNERIRTYNFPQGRITDHRINYTVYNLEAFLDGDIGDLIEEMIIADNKAKLEANME